MEEEIKGGPSSGGREGIRTPTSLSTHPLDRRTCLPVPPPAHSLEARRIGLSNGGDDIHAIVLLKEVTETRQASSGRLPRRVPLRALARDSRIDPQLVRRLEEILFPPALGPPGGALPEQRAGADLLLAQIER
jgi:hypothetical protein